MRFNLRFLEGCYVEVQMWGADLSYVRCTPLSANLSVHEKCFESRDFACRSISSVHLMQFRTYQNYFACALSVAFEIPTLHRAYEKMKKWHKTWRRLPPSLSRNGSGVTGAAHTPRGIRIILIRYFSSVPILSVVWQLIGEEFSLNYGHPARAPVHQKLYT